MTIELLSQIDITHWTVRFVDGPWKDKIGDYRIENQNLDAGQKVDAEVKHYEPRYKEPSVIGYCGRIEVKAAVEPAKKKTKMHS